MDSWFIVDKREAIGHKLHAPFAALDLAREAAKNAGLGDYRIVECRVIEEHSKPKPDKK